VQHEAAVKSEPTTDIEVGIGLKLSLLIIIKLFHGISKGKKVVS